MADGARPWLQTGAADDQRIALPLLGEMLRQYRAEHHLTQAALGRLLQVDQTYVSMIERGRRTVRDIGFLLRVSRVLEIPPADLGLSNELITEGPASRQASVRASQDEWRSVRRHLNHHRHDLAQLAAALYRPGTASRGRRSSRRIPGCRLNLWTWPTLN